MNSSVRSVLAPSTSESLPAPSRRMRSIWNRRSWAWAKPIAKAASASLLARTVTTPKASRPISTGALVPATRMVPFWRGSVCSSSIATPATSRRMIMPSQSRSRPMRKLSVSLFMAGRAASMRRPGGRLAPAISSASAVTEMARTPMNCSMASSPALWR